MPSVLLSVLRNRYAVGQLTRYWDKRSQKLQTPGPLQESLFSQLSAL